MDVLRGFNTPEQREYVRTQNTLESRDAEEQRYIKPNCSHC